MDNRLFFGGIVAIPLQAVEGFRPVPTHLVIDSFSSIVLVDVQNDETGLIEKIDSTIINYKIVSREILLANELFQEEFIERTLIPSEELHVSIDILPALVSHERVKLNIELVNQLLLKFKFRGQMNGFVMQVDLGELDNIIAQKNSNQPLQF